MRLMNTATKRLKSFYGKDIPPYAILSHVWGKDEDEVSLRHISGTDDERREGERRKGYEKIKKACAQAIQDGYGYIWVDTCCIDKESSAELSEAINSMYAWYRESDVCYAYLEDVPSDRSLRSDGNTTSKMVYFRNSKWFRRGWTLQELIAPRHVVFYSKDWVDIGTKATLQDTISDVTHIRVEMITGYDPRKASIAERMSWAAFRKTKREEDIAYCLIGILGVNMPLLYGEGKRAFMRLQEEIMKVSDDHSLFAWKTSYDYKGRASRSQETQGMLAYSPWNFRDAGSVVRIDGEGGYSPYFMTNRGLQIELPLLPVNPKEDRHLVNLVGHQNIFRAVLKCTYRDKEPTRWITIYLEMIREGCYIRIFPHWLDEVRTNPNEIHTNRNGLKLTTLLVMQIHDSMNGDSLGIRGFKIKILPTESGFKYKGEDLVEGYQEAIPMHENTEILAFGHEGKQFVVATGNDGGIPWLDFIDPDAIEKIKSHVKKITRYVPAQFAHSLMKEIRSLYDERGSRRNAVLRHLDRLTVNVTEDWAVDISAKVRRSLLGVVINIREVEEEWDDPILSDKSPDTVTVLPTGEGFPFDVNLHNLRPAFKREGSDWLASFNPKVKRALDVSLVHGFRHPSNMCCIRFSPDGKYLATGSGQTVHVYDVKTGDQIYDLTHKSTTNVQYSGIYSICFSFDSKLLATSAQDKRIRIWNITKKRVRYVFNSYQGRINSLHFSLDGRFIVSGSAEGTVRVWKIADGTSRVLAINYPTPFNGDVGATSVAISPNGQFVAAGSWNNTIWIWDIAAMRLVKKLQGHQGSVGSIAFTPDGKGLVSGSKDKTLKYWDVSGLDIDEVNESKEDSVGADPVNDSGASDTLVSENTDNASQFIMDFTGHMSCVSSTAVSHDGKWVISSSDERSVLFWDSENATTQFILHGHVDSVTSVDLSPMDNIFATNCKNGDVRIWKYEVI